MEAGEAASRPSPVDRYTNERFTGDPDRTWVDDVARHRSFKRGLVLGASGIEQDARLLETNPGLTLRIVDISGEALLRWQSELGARFPDRVTTQVVDLNFGDLPQPPYDLIVSSSTMHHVQNLERLAWQINESLTADGMFFLQDYCGENRYQFGGTKRRVFELLYARDVARRPGGPTGLEWMNEEEGRFSPFCAIRSQDTLAALAEHLTPVSVRMAGALLFPMLHTRPTGAWRRVSTITRLRHRAKERWMRLRGQTMGVSPEFFRELTFVGDVLADAGVILPANVYAVYRKRIDDVD